MRIFMVKYFVCTHIAYIFAVVTDEGNGTNVQTI